MVFKDPILAGNTLVRDAIQSENFEASATGWRIQRDGEAEFSNMNIRGLLSFLTPGGDPEDAGIGWDEAGESAINSIDYISRFLNGGQLYNWWTGDNWYLSHDSYDFGVGFDAGYLKRMNWNQLDYLDSFTFEEWSALDKFNGWGNSTDFDVLSAKLSVEGMVELTGAASKAGGNYNGQHFATLPVGKRPLNRQFLTASTNAGQSCCVIVEIDGRMIISTVFSFGLVSLTGQRFPLGVV